MDREGHALGTAIRREHPARRAGPCASTCGEAEIVDEQVTQRSDVDELVDLGDGQLTEEEVGADRTRVLRAAEPPPRA